MNWLGCSPSGSDVLHRNNRNLPVKGIAPLARAPTQIRRTVLRSRESSERLSGKRVVTTPCEEMFSAWLLTKCSRFRSGRESILKAGRAGEFSGACCMQHGCRLSHGIVAGGIVVKTDGKAGECTPRQQECSWAAGVVLDRTVGTVEAAIVTGGRLQQTTEARSSAAKVLVFMPACRVSQEYPT